MQPQPGKIIHTVALLEEGKDRIRRHQTMLTPLMEALIFNRPRSKASKETKKKTPQGL